MSKRGNVREPVTEDGSKANKNVRKGMGQQLKMDMTPYLEQYPNMQLMLINDIEGDVQRWLDAGAVPIPAKIPDRKIFEGLNDKVDNKWVRFVGGSRADNGETYYTYGLMMEPEAYAQYKHAPMDQRKADIKASMTAGKTDQDGGANLPGGGQVMTYAANLPTGQGQGYNELRPK